MCLEVAKFLNNMNVGKSFAKSALKNVETSLVLVVRVELQSTFLMSEVSYIALGIAL